MGKITQDQIQFSDKRISAEQVNFAQEPTILFPGAEPESIRGRIGRGAQAAFEFGEDVRGVTGAVAEPAERLLMENLPIAGAILGSPLGIPGVAGGAALGELGRQTQLGTQAPESADALLTGMVKEAAIGGLAELPALAIAGKVRAAGRPFAEKMTPEARLALETAEKRGLALSPSSVMPSRRASFFEWASDKIPPGNFLKDRQVQKLNDGMILMYEEALEGLPTQVSKFEAGLDVGEALKKTKTIAKEARKDAYANFAKSIADSKMENTIEVVNKSLNELAELGVDDKTRTFLGQWQLKRHTGWTTKDVVDFQAQLWRNTYPDHIKIGDEILEAVKKDVGEQASGFLDLGKQRFMVEKEIFETLGAKKNPTAGRIARLMAQGKTDDIIRQAITTGNFEDLAVIRKFIPKETWDGFRSRFIENLIEASYKRVGSESIYDPIKFARTIDRYEEQIKNLMPSMWNHLKGLANLGEFALRDIKRRPTPFGLKEAATTAASIGLIVPAGFSMFVANSLMKPSGLLKTWLTKGFDGKVVPELVRTGLRSGFMKTGEELLKPPELKRPKPELRGL
jgi:hypothetical protein